jgi:hypothetical protein
MRDVNKVTAANIDAWASCARGDLLLWHAFEITAAYTAHALTSGAEDTVRVRILAETADLVRQHITAADIDISAR